jgi:hypothetical protein
MIWSDRVMAHVLVGFELVILSDVPILPLAEKTFILYMAVSVALFLWLACGQDGFLHSEQTSVSAWSRVVLACWDLRLPKARRFCIGRNVRKSSEGPALGLP